MWQFVIFRFLIFLLPILNIYSTYTIQKPSTRTSYHMRKYISNNVSNIINTRCQWPHGLRRRSAAARLLRSWVRIRPGAWMFVCCECCMLSVRGLCDELITRPEESNRLWCVVVCDLETSRMRRPWPALGAAPQKKNIKNGISYVTLIQIYYCWWHQN
jgi:hypothetical protein